MATSQSVMPKVSVGRVVMYKVGPNDSAELKSNSAAVLPAIVVRVWGDQEVANLKVFTDGAIDVWKTSVAKGDGEYNWAWPERL